MARVTVEDCVRYYPNRFEMVVLASKRARQIVDGMPLLIDNENDKAAVLALREIGEGCLSWDVLFDFEAQEKARLEAQTTLDA